MWEGGEVDQYMVILIRFFSRTNWDGAGLGIPAIFLKNIAIARRNARVGMPSWKQKISD